MIDVNFTEVFTGENIEEKVELIVIVCVKV